MKEEKTEETTTPLDIITVYVLNSLNNFKIETLTNRNHKNYTFKNQ